MRIRTFDEVDPFQAHRLSAIAFGFAPREEEIRRYRKAAGHRLFDGFGLYAVERGKILAQVIPLRFPVRLTTGVEIVGGLAGVCSHPAVWGQGYARRLMEATHDLMRKEGLRIVTLTTSRNIRGYGVYTKLGYVDLAPFFRASRRIGTRRPVRGYRLRRATRKDLPVMLVRFREHTRDLLGWTERPEDFLRFRVGWEPGLDKYHVVLQGGETLGYLRSRPEERVTLEEAVIPSTRGFRAAVALAERRATGGVSTVNWLTAHKDLERFQRLGYTIDGPIPETTMALPLSRGVPRRSLVTLFGGPAGRFVHYPTEDF